MANNFARDILIQSPDPRQAAAFYVEQLGFTITSDEPVVELRGDNINLYIDQGPIMGPVLEVFVPSVEEMKNRLLASGCHVVKEETSVPCCYVRDPYGLIYNLARR